MFFKELFSVFKSARPIDSASKDFARMLALAQEMVLEASAVYWGRAYSARERTALYRKDVEVNKLQRRVRKQLVAHVTNTECRHVAYAMLIMSLAKDVERIGDYAKNLVELVDMGSEGLPEDENTRELAQIRDATEELVRSAADVFLESEEDAATELTIEGRNTAKRCDKLISSIAEANYEGATTVVLALGARFYKRIGGHVLNLLSGVIMPLHKLDYFDDRLISETER
jgi:phosphate transport system protein